MENPPERPETPPDFKACPLCEAPVPEGVRFCPQCGLTLGPPVRRRAVWPWLVALGVAGLAMLLVAALNLDRWQVRLYQRALEQEPDNPLLLNNLAYLYADELEENLLEAEKMAERAVQLAPDQFAFWDTLGWVYFKLGKYEKAVAPLVRGAQLDPREAACPYHLGAVYEALKQPDQARQAYRRAAALGGEYGHQARKALERLEKQPGTITKRRSRP